MNEPEYYYRAEDRPSIFGDRGVYVSYRRYPVIKHTPCGVWLALTSMDRRFVLKAAHKQFACPTKEAALVSFRARKRRQVAILTAQLERAKLALVTEPETHNTFAEIFLS